MAKALVIPKGTRFGNLTVLEEAERTSKSRRQFLCQCDCGNKKIVPLADLRSGHSKTCGCRGTVLRRIRIEDYIHKRYGKLVVIGEAEQKKGERYRVKCRCDCGNIKDYSLLNLENKIMPTRSCGCGRNEHDGIKNRSKEKLYQTYDNMKQRCLNPKTPNYYNYGGRGIKVCSEWLEGYPKFRKWAMENGYKEGLTLDRIDNNGDYEPNNCRWVDMKIQSNNTRVNVFITYNGETHTIAEWSDITGIPYHRLQVRYQKGMDLNKVFSKDKLVNKSN